MGVDVNLYVWGPDVSDEELDDKVLLCFCHPRLCHGDVLAARANARF